MNKSKHIRLLRCGADEEALKPIEEQLVRSGFRVDEGAAGKDDVVLAVLSEAFYKDKDLTDRLLGLIGAGADKVLPLQLDDAPIPEQLKNALYARNIIPAAGRDASLIAERIISALPRKKSRLPLVLAAAGLALIALVGFLIWRSAAGGEKLPAMETERSPVVIPEGWTAEDLALIEDALIIGDRMIFLNGEELDAAMKSVQDYFDPGEEAPFIFFDADLYAVLDQNSPDGQIRWYSMENGQELDAARYDDLRFLSLMPNLRYLSLVLVDVPADGLPDLSGAEKLEGVAILSCGIDGLSWLAGAPVSQMQIRFTPIRDFGALTACGKLGTLHVDMHGTDTEASFSSFAPPALHNFSLWNAAFSGTQDLSCLSPLSGLRTLQLLEPEGLKSLSGLESLELEDFEVVNGFQLEDISALSTQKKLSALTIDDCPAVRDFSPVGGCTALESVMLYPGWDVRLRDASFLGGLSELRDISLYSIDLPDLGFLTQLGRVRESIDALNFSGDVRDFSALADIGHYDRLGIDLYGGSMGQLPAELKDITVSYLYLRRLSGLDFSAMPKVTERLLVYECDCGDLSSVPEDWTAQRIQIYECSLFRSLEGLEKLSAFCAPGQGMLEIYHCPRLADWSALDGLDLNSLKINGSFSIPSFRDLHLELLRLENVEDLTDLDFLGEMDASSPCSFELIGLDGISSLEPLRRFRGDHLSVPPQLAEQAEDLVEAGNFGEYRVEYPSGGWQIDDSVFVLNGLDELETLPKALLRHVSTLCVAGERIIDPERFEVIEDAAHGLVLYDRDTGGTEELGQGSVNDLSIFSDLTGLRELSLCRQPVRDLEGVQRLSSLESFRAEYCGELRDASALFTLQSLTELSLKASQIDSIQGVQNLYELRTLDISHTKVSDLKCLAGLEKLESVTLSRDMTKASSSLDGTDYSFTLIVTD